MNNEQVRIAPTAGLKIVQLVTQMEAGGAQGAAVRMADELRQRGHQVEVWFFYEKNPTYADSPWVKVLMSRRPRHAGHVVALLIRIYRELRRHQPDAVVAYTHYACVIGLAAAFLAGIRSRVATMRNPAWTFPRGARIANRIMGSIGAYTTCLVVSDAVRQSFSGYSRSFLQRIRLVYNGVANTPSQLSRSQARAQFSLPTAPLLVSVGRLHFQKNHRLLVSILTDLPECHLAIAGAGELKDALNQQARELGVEERLHLLGEVPPALVQDFLRAGDVFVFPSIFEAFGFALFDAATSGLPIVASDIPASREVLRAPDGELAGVLVPLNDASAWSVAVKRLLDDEPLRARLAALAQAQAARFSLHEMADGYEECIRQPLLPAFSGDEAFVPNPGSMRGC